MANNEKKPAGFFLYPEHVRAASAMLTLSDLGRLLLALCEYAQSGALPDTRRKSFQACFTLLQADVDRDIERYREICERNREYANRRWHNTPMPQHADACQRMPPHAYTTQPNTTLPNPTLPNTTQPNINQLNPAPAAAASAAPGSCSPSVRKGVHHDQAANPRKPASARGTVL